MLYYDKIDIRKGIDVAKSNNSKEFISCHYQLINHEFKFQDSVCNGCRDLTMLCLNVSDIAIITFKGVHYRCSFLDFSKSEATYLLENSVLERGYINIKNLVYNFNFDNLVKAKKIGN